MIIVSRITCALSHFFFRPRQRPVPDNIFYQIGEFWIFHFEKKNTRLMSLVAHPLLC